MPRTREPTGHGPAWQVQAAEIARLFYLDGLSKVEIADRLALSRFKVARILDDAVDRGLVEVTIRAPAPIDVEASASLAHHLLLRRALVLGNDADDDRETIGRLAATLLTEILGHDDVLGLSCSRTVTATTHALTELPAVDVVQLTGTLAGSGTPVGSVESVRHAARIGGGTGYCVYAPMVVDDAGAATSLRREPSIRQTFEQIPRVSVAMVSVGGWSDGTSTVWELASRAERVEGRRAGVVGEIGGRRFDADGSPVVGGLDDRVISATLDQLRAVDEVVGLAVGPARADAVRGAVAGGIVDTVIGDHGLANSLLSMPPIEETP